MKNIDKKENIWAHLICINWTPEMYFKDEQRNEVEGIVNLERFKLTCHQCLKKNNGSCI